MKFEQDEKYMRVTVVSDDGGSIESQSVSANLLFAILEMLEDIKACVIDVEEAINPR